MISVDNLVNWRKYTRQYLDSETFSFPIMVFGSNEIFSTWKLNLLKPFRLLSAIIAIVPISSCFFFSYCYPLLTRFPVIPRRLQTRAVIQMVSQFVQKPRLTAKPYLSHQFQGWQIRTLYLFSLSPFYILKGFSGFSLF